MRSALYLAWRYLLFNRGKTSTLVAAITITIFLPLALELVLDRSSERLAARAAATPILLGARGSPLELALSSLYFDGTPPESTTWATAKEVRSTGLAHAIPLLVRYRVAGQPVVGTSIDYFDFRGLRIERGRMLTILGEAVVGATAAERLGVGPGESVVTSPETVFDVAGVYPLKLHVIGVLEQTGTPDDHAIFVDTRTAWVIAGIGHGHEDLAGPGGVQNTLSREGNTLVANASVVEFREITPENLAEFHFHGDIDSLPLTAVIAVPNDEKTGVLLEGRYQNQTSSVQLVRPTAIMDRLLGTVLTVRQYVLTAVLLIGAVTLTMIVLTFVLSARLRRNEILTMRRIGAPPSRLVLVLGVEILLVLLISVSLAFLLTGTAAIFGDALFRALLLSGRA